MVQITHFGKRPYSNENEGAVKYRIGSVVNRFHMNKNKGKISVSLKKD